MTTLDCPYLAGVVELTAEREEHIALRHPELLPEHRSKLRDTLRDPDVVRRSARGGSARMFSRWYDDGRHGKHVVVVVVTDDGKTGRHWVITAYVSSQLSGGETEWERG